MSNDATIEIRTIVEEELSQYSRMMTWGFGSDPLDGEAERVKEVIGLDRVNAAFDGKQLVGTSAAYTLNLAVPGAVDVPTAGLTRVSVAQTHRRRGILTGLMEAHFDDAVAHDEPLSALWASEVAIYGRFGYGQASENVRVDVDARTAGLIPPENPDDLQLVSAEEERHVLPALHERIRIHRPGHFHRSEAWWTHRRFADHEWMREGASSRRCVLAYRAGQPVGYVTYRQKQDWSDNDLPNGETRVIELMAIDPPAEHTLWWHLANIDLFPKVSVWTQPTDGIIPALAGNVRGVQRRLTDGIHLRVLDVPRALSSRRYTTHGSLTIEVSDGPLSRSPTTSRTRHSIAGTYELSAGEDGVATCQASDTEPDVQVSAYGLAALYLGSAAIGGLELRGHVKGSPEALDRLRRCFSWPVAAWCNEVF